MGGDILHKNPDPLAGPLPAIHAFSCGIMARSRRGWPGEARPRRPLLGDAGADVGRIAIPTVILALVGACAEVRRRALLASFYRENCTSKVFL